MIVALECPHYYSTVPRYSSLGQQIERAQKSISPEDFWDEDGNFNEEGFLAALEIAQDYVLDGLINQ